MIKKNLERELPFLASEHLLMEAVKQGGDRQDVHEAIRRASHVAARAIKDGEPNPLRELFGREPVLAKVAGRLDELLDGARFVGRAPEQVGEFLAAEVDPLLVRHKNLLGARGDVRI